MKNWDAELALFFYFKYLEYKVWLSSMRKMQSICFCKNLDTKCKIVKNETPAHFVVRYALKSSQHDLSQGANKCKVS